MYNWVLKLKLSDKIEIGGYADDIVLVVVDKRQEYLKAKCKDAPATKNLTYHRNPYWLLEIKESYIHTYLPSIHLQKLLSGEGGWNKVFPTIYANAQVQLERDFAFFTAN